MQQFPTLGSLGHISMYVVECTQQGLHHSSRCSKDNGVKVFETGC